MSLRLRMGLAAGVAVAVAVVAVVISAYAGTRSELRGQLDHSLRQLAEPFLRNSRQPVISFGEAPRDGQPAPATRALPSEGGARIASGDCDSGLGIDERRPPAFGGAEGYVQLVLPDGRICLARDESVAIPPDDEIRGLAKHGTGRIYTDAHARSVHLRVMAVGVGHRGALLVALRLDAVDETLHRELLLLVLIGASGIALAAILGLLVARTALAPIGRFTRQTEMIAERPDRIEEERVEVHGSDELARLAHTFNATLEALERSVQAQRNLVADASHELRTPIASIRANLQLMQDEERLSPEDRAALRTDVIEELDELTRLVSDVVELARGSKLTAEPGELRLDEVVAEALTRARRRAPALSFESSLEPTLIHGDGERVARAVSNLLDNAMKWSPAGEVVEVRLRDGLLTVRDHGPGFDPDDLPFVFDRFHRAKHARSKPGSGLGLAIVRQAAEAHGGFVEAANEPGGGALLRLSFGATLPLTELERDDALRV